MIAVVFLFAVRHKFETVAYLPYGFLYELQHLLIHNLASPLWPG